MGLLENFNTATRRHLGRKEEAIRLERFGMYLVEGGNVVIPLQQSGCRSGTLDGALVQLPNRVKNRVIVRVEDVLLEFRMASDVDLRDALRRDAVDVVHGIELMVLRRHVDVIHVEQDAAIGGMDHLIQKLPLGHLGVVICRIAADVFDSDRNFEVVLHHANPFGCRPHSLERIRQRQQVVGIATVHAAPAKMIGEPGSLGALGQFLDAPEVVAVQAAVRYRSTWRHHAEPLDTGRESGRES